MTLNLENYTFDEDANGDLIIVDPAGNTIATHDDTANEWQLSETLDVQSNQLLNAVLGAAQINDLTDATSGATVYDATTETLGDGTQDANLQSLSAADARNKTVDRPLWNPTDKTVSVDPSGGADYTSISDAVQNEVANLHGGRVTISLAPAAYGEDITIEGIAGDFGIRESAVVIEGDTTAPGNYTGLSIETLFCSARIEIRGVTLDREAAFSTEGAAAISYDSSGELRVSQCKIGAVTRGVESYGGNVEVHQVDFGNQTENAEVVKHSGKLFESGDGASNITGTTSSAKRWVQSGLLAFDTNANLSGGRNLVQRGSMYDEYGRPRGHVEVGVLNGSTATMRQTNHGSDAEFATPGKQRTNGVGTAATTIFTMQDEQGDTVAFGGFVAVHGGYDDAGTIRTFTDLVTSVRGGSPAQVASAESNTPATRSYSMSGSELQLSMGSGSYEILASGESFRTI